MTKSEIPRYIFNLAIGEEVVAKTIAKILEDFNIYVDEEKALKLFQCLIVHLMYYMDTHPGQYMKLKYMDITVDRNNLLSIKRSSDYTKDMINPQMLYNKYCSDNMLLEEFDKNMDLFARSFLSIKETKNKEIHSLNTMITRRKKLRNESAKCTEIVKGSKKLKALSDKVRKEDERTMKSMIKKKISSAKVSNAELLFRRKHEDSYKMLEAQLREQYEKDNTIFPF